VNLRVPDAHHLEPLQLFFQRDACPHGTGMRTRHAQAVAVEYRPKLLRLHVVIARSRFHLAIANLRDFCEHAFEIGRHHVSHGIQLETDLLLPVGRLRLRFAHGAAGNEGLLEKHTARPAAHVLAHPLRLGLRVADDLRNQLA
jgi:hypothetical protein